jgi:tetratricopeptide (TPR) repeat protein
VIHNLAVVAEKAAAHVKAGRYWGEVVNRWKKKLEKDRDNEYLRLCIVEALQHHGDYMDEHPEANPASPPPPPPPSQAPVSPSAPTAPLRSPAATGGTPMQSSANVRKPEIPRPQATPAPAPAAPAGSIDRYREIARLKPDDFDAQFQLCSKLVEGQLYEEALTELGKLAKAHPKNIEVLNMMGWAYLYVGKKDEGFNCWKRSMAIDPKNAETRDHLVRAHLSLGRSFRQKGMFTQALVHFKQLLTLMPRSVEVHMEIAATYDMKGDVRSAASEYARVLTIDPKHKDARKAMNDLRMKR